MSETPGHRQHFRPHSQRATILGEIHARPFRPVEGSRAFLLYAFEVFAGDAAHADRAALDELCRAQGQPAPREDARHHLVPFAGGTLRWERHAEFTTYTWDGALADPGQPFQAVAGSPPFGDGFQQPGPLVVAVRLDIITDPGPPARSRLLSVFEPASLCVSDVEDGRGTLATDFRQDGDGRTRVLLIDNGLTPAEAGGLAQRALEIELYRTYAMLGLPTAQKAAPTVTRIEGELARLTAAIRESSSLADNRKLLDDLTTLTADLEACAAQTSFRFGASTAYHQIVVDRLQSLVERAAPGFSGWAEFLGRRLEPAMRTVTAMAERQANLSRKLARAAQLLRTRVDIELEQQSRDLLNSMNDNARAQLIMQETVEGLSVAAVSYYVVGLLGYVFKALKEAHVISVDPAILTGLSVPFVALAAFFIVRRIRVSHRRRSGHHSP
jgi:uncharacterized membrane-anchored protein